MTRTVTRAVPRTRLALGVGQRLFLGVLPALLNVALVVGLAYYGQYARTAPEYVVMLGMVLALSSLVLTWRNARDIAARIARLAGPGNAGAAHAGVRGARVADELDRIEQVVEELGTALSASEAERVLVEKAASVRLREHATLLSATVRLGVAQLDEVRLALHVLLEAKFGELNENQEELLGTARDAADAMDTALRRLGQVADADRGALVAQREPVQVNDVIRAILPLVRAAAERRGARVDVRLEPAMPRASGDRVRLAEALTIVAEAAAACAGAATPVVIGTDGVTVRDSSGVRITIAPIPAGVASDAGAQWERDVLVARRLIEAQGGLFTNAEGGVTIVVG